MPFISFVPRELFALYLAPIKLWKQLYSYHVYPSIFSIYGPQVITEHRYRYLS